MDANPAVSAVRFLYAVTLGREPVDLMASVPHMKRATPRAEVYARSEVEAILTAPIRPYSVSSGALKEQFERLEIMIGRLRRDLSDQRISERYDVLLGDLGSSGHPSGCREIAKTSRD